MSSYCIKECWGVWRSNEDGAKTSFVGGFSTKEKAEVVANAPGVRSWGPGKIEPIPVLELDDGRVFWLESISNLDVDQGFSGFAEAARKAALEKLSPADRAALGL
jgi:hypothetical protein